MSRGLPANGLHGQHMPDGTRVTTCVSDLYSTKEHVNLVIYFAVQLVLVRFGVYFLVILSIE